MLAGSSILSTANHAAAYHNLKREQREAWERGRQLTKENWVRFAKEHDVYYRPEEDPRGMFTPDLNRHYDGTPR